MDRQTKDTEVRAGPDLKRGFCRFRVQATVVADLYRFGEVSDVPGVFWHLHDNVDIE